MIAWAIRQIRDRKKQLLYLSWPILRWVFYFGDVPVILKYRLGLFQSHLGSQTITLVPWRMNHMHPNGLINKICTYLVEYTARFIVLLIIVDFYLFMLILVDMSTGDIS